MIPRCIDLSESFYLDDKDARINVCAANKSKCSIHATRVFFSRSLTEQKSEKQKKRNRETVNSFFRFAMLRINQATGPIYTSTCDIYLLNKHTITHICSQYRQLNGRYLIRA